jgi:hypothetical protein
MVWPTVISFQHAEADQEGDDAAVRWAAAADDVEAELAPATPRASMPAGGRPQRKRHVGLCARRAGPARLADDAQALLHLLEADEHVVECAAVVADGMSKDAVVDAKGRPCEVPGDMLRSMGPLSEALIAAPASPRRRRARIMMTC